MKSPALPYIIKHEMEHARSGGFFDYEIEREPTPKIVTSELKRLAPFYQLSYLVPISWWKDGEKYSFGLDPIRTLFLSMVFVTVLGLHFLSTATFI